MNQTPQDAIEIIASEVHFSWAIGRNVLKIGNSEAIDDVRLEGVDAVELHFPKFTDGRAYSQAVQLRRRRGFDGRIVATGDVLVDQVVQLGRCGFSACVLRADQDVSVARRQFAHFPDYYQGDAQAAKPFFSRVASGVASEMAGTGGATVAGTST